MLRPLGGNQIPVSNQANPKQVAFDAGGRRILMPIATVARIPDIPGERRVKFQSGFVGQAVDAVFRAMGCNRRCG